MPTRASLVEDDDDCGSAGGDDPAEQQERYEFLDAASVASLGLTAPTLLNDSN